MEGPAGSFSLRSKKGPNGGHRRLFLARVGIKLRETWAHTLFFVAHTGQLKGFGDYPIKGNLMFFYVCSI